MRLPSAVLAAGLTAALAGCASATAPQPGPAPSVAEARGVAAIEPAADPRPLGAADTAFGLDVLRAWCAQYPDQNLVFSPSTLASALGMAYLGAHGATADAMARVLHLATAGGTTLAAGLQARTDALGSLSGPGVTLAPSDEVWADPSLPPLTSYLDAVATGYRAGLAKAPFLTDQAKAADEVNAAIAAATRGHIPHLVSPGMLSDVGWVLTSALYMNAKWATPFDPTKTTKDDFTLADGKTVLPSYLEGNGFNYVKAGGWTAVDLPYKGGKLTMTALLPPAGSRSCMLPSQASLAAITASLRAGGSGVAVARQRGGVGRTADVELPKVSLSTGGETGDMKPVLQRLGMGLAFTAQADFTGLSKLAGNLAFVQQAATLQVAEKGTVAAAAAAVGVMPASAQANPVTITFDRPYLMLVSAKSTGEPLFLAEVANPTAS
ncbi:MAG TPA: serpin family protein [Trebonia sp.]|nr:serpin family protein [Trebonia sp.]